MPLSNQGRLSFFTPLLRSCPRRARRRKGTQTKKDGTDGTDLRMCLPRCRRRQGTSRSPGTARVAGPPAGCGDNSHKLAREERRLHTTMSLPRPPSLPPSLPPFLSPTLPPYPPHPPSTLFKRERVVVVRCAWAMPANGRGGTPSLLVRGGVLGVPHQRSAWPPSLLVRAQVSMRHAVA